MTGYGAKSLTGPMAPTRRVTGALRIAAGLLVLAAIATQIVDQVAHDAFVPEEYFSYFTIESSIINVAVLLAAGWFAWQRSAVDRLDRRGQLFTSIRMSIVAYAVVTAGVYNVLLRHLPSEGFVGIQWPNEVMHVWIPIFIALDWLFAPDRPALAWRRMGIAVVYPLAWVAFTLLRGAVTGWYPYPFLEPFGPGGWGSVLLYILGIAVFILFIASAAIAISRIAAGRMRAR